MGLSKIEINLRRLLVAAPQQQNRAKLIHYVTTLREQLEQLGAETTSEGMPSFSKAKLNEYAEQIEALAGRLETSLPESVEIHDDETSACESQLKIHEAGSSATSSSGLRKRFVTRIESEESLKEIRETASAMPVKLDDSAQAHIEKQRKLQEDLTDEMVVLAQQLKESSAMMSRSLDGAKKIIDSTEVAVEYSLTSTGQANARATKVYSETSKTTCFTWLVIFLMTCIFVMVVLLIRIT